MQSALLRKCSRCGRRQANYWCKQCQSQYNHDYYNAHRERFIGGYTLRVRASRLRLNRLKHLKPCVDCGGAFPYFLLDLDHLEGKVRALSRARGWGWERTLTEFAKCELVCVNCHRARSFWRTRRVARPRRRRWAPAVVRFLKVRSRCSDCGQRVPFYAIDLDHLGDKRFAARDTCSRAMTVAGLVRELRKCQAVCANCHRLRSVLRTYCLGEEAIVEAWKELEITAQSLGRWAILEATRQRKLPWWQYALPRDRNAGPRPLGL